MKKGRLFFVLLMSAILLASCQKPGGDVPGSWISASGNKAFVKCSFTHDIDYAAYTMKVDLTAVDAESVQIDKLELQYGVGNLPMVAELSDLKKLTLLKDTVLTTDMEFKDTLWNLTPETNYSYLVMLSDFMASDTAASGNLKTLDPGTPRVVIDSTLLRNGRIYCYASAYGNKRAMREGSVYKIFVGNSEEDVNDEVEALEIFSETAWDDSVKVSFFGNVVLSLEELWFRAYAMNVWERKAWSEAKSYLYSSQPIAATVKADLLGPTTVLMKGKTQKGIQDVILSEAGFLLATHPDPTIADEVIKVEDVIWDRSYETIVENLLPNTTYYFRAYLRIGNAIGQIYMGDVMTFQTSSSGDDPGDDLSLEVTMNSLPAIVANMVNSANSLLVTAYYSGELGTHSVTERGFVYCKKGMVDAEDLTEENCLGSATGLPVSEMPQLSSYASYFPDNSYATQVSQLEASTTYVFRAYMVVDGDGVKRYSDNTVEISTKDQ